MAHGIHLTSIHLWQSVALLAGLLFLQTAGRAEQLTPADYVRPQIDTHKCRWFYFSSACRPFGMVNLSPDTRTGEDWGGGYIYGESKIRGFSHVHCWQLYGISVLPTTGEMKGHLGMDAYQADFSHDDEVVRPGYHKVVLKNYGVVAELTSTMRVGFHRYTFPAGKESRILFDTGATLMAGMNFSEVRKAGAAEVEGYSVMSATMRRPKPTPVYFVARFSKPFAEFGGWQDKKLIDGSIDSVSGKNAGAYVTFTTEKDERVLMKVAISYTSIDNARKNLEAEAADWDFDRVKSESFDEWNRWLGRIQIAGGTENQRIKFYTDLWHALLGRRIISDADGSYCDMTGAKPVIRRVRCDGEGKPLFPHHNFDANWGSHWNLNILWSMVYPEVMDAFCNTMVDMYANGGLIPRGPSGGNYTYVMIGDSSAPLLAAAYSKGIRSYDTAKAYEGLRKNAFPGGIRDHAGYEHDAKASGGGMKYYIERGYVPENIEGKGIHKDGASMTLEYAYQDWCVAQMAKAMGKEEDYQLFMKRSKNYRHLWDASVGWMRPRNKDGSWLKDFQPVVTGEKAFNGKGFCEANSAIYTHFVPHDPQGLFELFGSPSQYVEKLNHQFELAEKVDFVVPHGVHGLAWVDYENQPSLGMAYMFNWAQAPWLSQKWVRLVKEKTFPDVTPMGGYHGDEDQGQMGALGVLMAIGLFDEQGGAAVRPTYQITSPIFEKITIQLDGRYYPGRQFVIATTNNSSANMYIQSAKLNGAALNKCWFDHSTFAGGGQLEIDLGPQPNMNWSAGPESVPPAN